MLTKVSTDKAPAAIGPYSQGIIAGHTDQYDIFFVHHLIKPSPCFPYFKYARTSTSQRGGKASARDHRRTRRGRFLDVGGGCGRIHGREADGDCNRRQRGYYAKSKILFSSLYTAQKGTLPLLTRIRSHFVFFLY